MKWCNQSTGIVAAQYSHKEWMIIITMSCYKHEWQSNSNSEGGHSNWMNESSLTECKPPSTLKLTTDQNPNWLNWVLTNVGVQ